METQTLTPNLVGGWESIRCKHAMSHIFVLSHGYFRRVNLEVNL